MYAICEAIFIIESEGRLVEASRGVRFPFEEAYWAALSSATQYAMPPDYCGIWRTERLKH